MVNRQKQGSLTRLYFVKEQIKPIR